MYNPLYAWQKKQDKQSNYRVDPYSEAEKKLKKSVSKKLRQQQYSKHLIHEMDEEMFSSICEMLSSGDDGNIQIAREIIFKSKLYPHQIYKLVQNQKYRWLIKYGSFGEYNLYETSNTYYYES